MESIEQWGVRWGVHPGAISELRMIMGVHDPGPVDTNIKGMSEAAIQQRIRIDSSQHGCRLWRNNNGATLDENGRMIRFGLANDSAKVNKEIKSSDLIGITPRIITAYDVGVTVGIFTSIEVKRPGWGYTAQPREIAQLKWVTLVRSMGGIGKFTTTAEGWRE